MHARYAAYAAVVGHQHKEHPHRPLQCTARVGDGSVDRRGGAARSWRSSQLGRRSGTGGDGVADGGAALSSLSHNRSRLTLTLALTSTPHAHNPHTLGFTPHLDKGRARSRVQLILACPALFSLFLHAFGGNIPGPLKVSPAAPNVDFSEIGFKCFT